MQKLQMNPEKQAVYLAPDVILTLFIGKIKEIQDIEDLLENPRVEAMTSLLAIVEALSCLQKGEFDDLKLQYLLNHIKVTEYKQDLFKEDPARVQHLRDVAIGKKR